jgi:hypothetical protein
MLDVTVARDHERKLLEETWPVFFNARRFSDYEHDVTTRDLGLFLLLKPLVYDPPIALLRSSDEPAVPSIPP